MRSIETDEPTPFVRAGAELASITEQAAEWFLRARERRLTASEERALTRWFRQSPRHIAEFIRVYQLHGLLREAKLQPYDQAPARVAAISAERIARASRPVPWMCALADGLRNRAVWFSRFVSTIGPRRHPRRQPRRDRMADVATLAGPTVTGLFRSRPAAERAYRSALSLGYGADDINVIMSEETRTREFAGGKETPLAEKAADTAPESSPSAEAMGGPVGGTVGTIAPVIAALGTLLLIPGLGLVAAGPVAVALAAAGAVGVAGGLIGALTHWGVPKSRVEEYEAAVRRGGILLGVKAKSEEDARQLAAAWKESGGEWLHY